MSSLSATSPTDPLSPRTVLRTVLIVLVVALAVYVLYRLRKPISWLVLATFLAIAMSGPVNLLERRMKRGLAIAGSYLLLLLVPFGIAAIVVPPVVRGANDLIDNLPGYVSDLQRWVNKNPKLKKLDQDYDITAKLKKEAAKAPEKAGTAASILADIGVGLVNSIFAGVTILILSIFMVGGARRWRARVLAMVPPDRTERIDRLLDNIASAVGNFIAGALAQAAIAGVSTFVVLKILGVPFAAPLAVLMAIFDLIPLVGATLAAIIVGLVTVFTDFPTTTIIWTIWAVVYQQIENNLIQPRIQSKAVNIPGFLVLVSVLFGSALFGVAGALLAIPIAASIGIAVQEYWAYRRESVLLGDEPPEASPQPPPQASPGPAPA